MAQRKVNLFSTEDAVRGLSNLVWCMYHKELSNVHVCILCDLVCVNSPYDNSS